MKKWVFGVLAAAVLTGCSDKEDTIKPDVAEEQDTAINPQTEELVPTGFKNMQLTKNQKDIIVKGEAKAENGKFYYKVETQDGKELQPEKEVKLAHPHAYLPYELNLDRSKLGNSKVVILEMFGKNEQGQATENNYFPIETDEIETEK